mmetsp:Transcript_96065/g.220231  ORF Transcript_96065/g.220231 Transcript_96065/m.220231 type:complete len:521 (-) Transcript_96065:11-1573(-)
MDARRGSFDRECGVCYTPYGPLADLEDSVQRLSPCGHAICKACCDKVTKLARTRSKVPLCPFCRQVFFVAQRVPPLGDLCLRRIAFQLPPAAQLKKLPLQTRARLLGMVKNRRLLYADRLLACIEGVGSVMERLVLSDLENASDENIIQASRLALGSRGSAVRLLALHNIPMAKDSCAGRWLEVVKGPQLEELQLTTLPELEGGCFERLSAASFPNLRVVNLQDSAGLQASALLLLCQSLRDSLEQALFGGCRRIEDRVLVDGLAQCPRLSAVDIRGCWQISTPAVLSVLESCVGLQSVNISKCGNLDGGVLLRGAAENCSCLHEFDVGCVDGVDDDAVMCLAASEVGPHLRVLGLESSSDVTDVSLEVLREHCPQLRRLDISRNSSVTEDAIIHFASGHQNCMVLQVSNCRRVGNHCRLLLGSLLSGRTVSSAEAPVASPTRVRRPRLQEPQTMTDPDAAIAELLTLGFPLERVQAAVGRCATVVDAVEWLLAEEAPEAVSPGSTYCPTVASPGGSSAG